MDGLHTAFQHGADNKGQEGAQNQRDYQSHRPGCQVGSLVQGTSGPGACQHTFAFVQIIRKAAVPIVLLKIIQKNFLQLFLAVVGKGGVSIAVRDQGIIPVGNGQQQHYTAFFASIAHLTGLVQLLGRSIGIRGAGIVGEIVHGDNVYAALVQLRHFRRLVIQGCHKFIRHQLCCIQHIAVAALGSTGRETEQRKHQNPYHNEGDPFFHLHPLLNP